MFLIWKAESIVGNNILYIFQFQIKAKLSGKRLERLDEPLISLASDTYTESELAT